MKRFYFLLFLFSIFKLCFAQELIKFQENGKYGFKNSNNEVVIPPQYEDAHYFSYRDGSYCVRKNNKWGVIDMQGNVKINFIHDYIDELSDSWKGSTTSLTDMRACVVKNGVKGSMDAKMGYIDGYGNEKIPIIYDSDVHRFDGPYTYIRKNGKHGYIDREGKIIIDFKYQRTLTNFFDKEVGCHVFWVMDCTNGYAKCKEYFMNSNGECVKECDIAGLPFAPSVLAAREEARKKQDEQNRLAEERRQNELRQKQQEDAHSVNFLEAQKKVITEDFDEDMEKLTQYQESLEKALKEQNIPNEERKKIEESLKEVKEHMAKVQESQKATILLIEQEIQRSESKKLK